MSILKKFFGKSADVPFEELARDMSLSEYERARRIAQAFNRAQDPAPYLNFRDEQVCNMERVYEWVPKVFGANDHLRRTDEKHRNELKQLALKGADALVESA